MISAKKSNSVKNTTNNMYKKQIIFVEIDKNMNSKEKKMVVSYSYNILKSIKEQNNYIYT
jgi:hypothetical protein